MLDRVRTWMTDLAGRGEPIVAITHPAVVRAPLCCAH
ncbi:hypothetical protein [Nocardia sp. NPDC051981]